MSDSGSDTVNTNTAVKHDISSITESSNIPTYIKANTTPRQTHYSPYTNNNKLYKSVQSPYSNANINSFTTTITQPPQVPSYAASQAAYIPQSPAYVYSPSPYSNTQYSPGHYSPTHYSPTHYSNTVNNNNVNSSSHLSPVRNFSNIIPQSPRIDTIQSINQRIENLQRNGRINQLLKHVNKTNKNNSSKRNSVQYTDSSKSQSINSNTFNSMRLLKDNTNNNLNQPTQLIDKLLRRKYILRLLHNNIIVSGKVYNKTNDGLTINLCNVYIDKNDILVNIKDIENKPRLSNLSNYINNLLIDNDDLNIHINICNEQLKQAGNSNNGSIDNSDILNKYSIGDNIKCIILYINPYTYDIQGSIDQSLCKHNSDNHILGLHKQVDNNKDNNKLISISSKSLSQSPPTYIQSPHIHNSNSITAYSPSYTTTNDTTITRTLPPVYNTPYGFPSTTSTTVTSTTRRSKYKTINNTISKQIQRNELFNVYNGYTILCSIYSIQDSSNKQTLMQYTIIDDRYTADSLRVLQNNSWARDSVLRGISYAKRSLFDQSMKCYNYALDIQPRFVQAYIARGAAYVLMNQLQQAIIQFKTALTIDNNNTYAKQYLDDAEKRLKLQENNDISNTTNDNTIERKKRTYQHNIRNTKVKQSKLNSKVQEM